MSNAHSLAPWKIEGGRHNMLTIRDASGNTPAIAKVLDAHGSQEANARLIAASPDLLSSAIAVIKWYDGFKELHGQTADVRYLADLRAAIAKAEGT